MDSKPIQALIVLVTLYLIMSVDNSGKWVKIINQKMLPGKWKLRYRARGVLILVTSCQSEIGIRNRDQEKGKIKKTENRKQKKRKRKTEKGDR